MNKQTSAQSQSQCEQALKILPERRFCAYMHRVCQQPRVANRKYCLRHILEDRDSPYKQCQYVHPTTQRKCRYPATKTDRREYLCKLHANKAKKNPKRVMTLHETPHKIFESLEIYCQKSEHNAQMAATSRSTLKFFDPDSDQEAPLIENCYIYDGDSDAESVDEEITDIKKNAGVYTAEEVAVIAKEKMQRLQSLYFEQFQRIRYLYKERKRDYFYRKQFEKPYIGKEFTNPREERLYRRYIAYKNYRRVHGTEALLKHKMNVKRQCEADHVNYPPTKIEKEMCNEPDCVRVRTPLTEFCNEHILNDKEQLLFKECGIDGCMVPVLNIRGCDVCPEHVTLKFDTQKLLEEALPEGFEMREDTGDKVEGIEDLTGLPLDPVSPEDLLRTKRSGPPVEGDESTDSAMSDDGLPTDTALYDDEMSSPQPGPSRAPQKDFEALKGRSVRIVGGQQIEVSEREPLQSAPDFIMDDHLQAPQ